MDHALEEACVHVDVDFIAGRNKHSVVAVLLATTNVLLLLLQVLPARAAAHVQPARAVKHCDCSHRSMVWHTALLERKPLSCSPHGVTCHT